YAIELRFEDAKLGYVPKGTNELISLLLFFGHDDVFETRVVQVNKDKDPWKQVRVGIYITDKR
ncbi:MAG: serine protease, partial [Eggerthellaceae bacterium]|nr:serine protease [Eggerthellaceae bacterium]